MICYRDRTYCPFYEGCAKGQECYMALTPQVREAAIKWWGSEDAPICQYVNKPECFTTKEMNHE